ncbi:MAG: D-alanine--D-alanine ligase, partial [Bacteroidota bacterium]
MSSQRIRIAVLYGGRSGEHEISLQSAASVIRNLDPERFTIIPIGIDRDGGWHLNDLAMIRDGAVKSLPVFRDAPSVMLPPFSGDGERSLLRLGGDGEAEGIDLVFPVMHGPLCEDGAIQGLCE